jgi:putative endonuclease
MRGGWVYIMTNAPFGTLYVGVTSDLARRVSQHRAGEGSDFCKRHRLTRLVYCEPFESIEDAIAREKSIKAWKRQWKTKRIEEMNPGWDDLFEQVIGFRGVGPSLLFERCRDG